MTIKELINLVNVAAEANLPTAKALRESGEEVVLRHIASDGSEVCVYKNGFVTYRVGRHVTVFSVGDVTEDYTFEFVGERKTISAGELEDMDCMVRLIMEGEDRINKNTDVLYGRKKVSYSQEAEDWGVMADTEDQMAKAVDKMFAKSLIGCLTDRQKEYVRRHFFEEEQMKEIGDDLGVSKQAVSDGIRLALAKMKAEAEGENAHGRKK